MYMPEPPLEPTERGISVISDREQGEIWITDEYGNELDALFCARCGDVSDGVGAFCLECKEELDLL